MYLYKCQPSDIQDLIEMGKETYYDTFHAMNSDATMTQYLTKAFSRTKIEAEIRHPNSSFYFLIDKEKVAYMKINFFGAQTDVDDPESLELERIYVQKQFKGCGYGKVLINETIAIARSSGLKYVWLGVWEKNKQALLFYEKMGFEKMGTHHFLMGDEWQNDYLLKRML